MTKSKTVDKSGSDDKILSELEKLKAKAEAGDELRLVYDEKFSRFDEKFGSLNEQILLREKEIEKLELVATRAADLVEEVQPEQLLSEARKAENKVEVVKSKLEAFEGIHEAIFDELKDLKRTVRVFGGTEDLVKMNKSILKDQILLKRMQSNVEKHADKVESMYGDMQKSFDDYSNYKQLFKDVQEDVFSMRSEFDNKLPKIDGSASKQDILDLKLLIKNLDVKVSEKISSTIKEVDLFKEEMSNNFKGLKKDVNDVSLALLKTSTQIGKSLDANRKALTRYEDVLRTHVNIKSFEKLDKSFTGLKNDSVSHFKFLKELGKIVHSQEKQIDKLKKN